MPPNLLSNQTTSEASGSVAKIAADTAQLKKKERRKRLRAKQAQRRAQDRPSTDPTTNNSDVGHNLRLSTTEPAVVATSSHMTRGNKVAGRKKMVIEKDRPRILQTIAERTNSFISAPTGYGKSCGVLWFLLDDYLKRQPSVNDAKTSKKPLFSALGSPLPLCVFHASPTGLTARNVAEYVAEGLTGTKLGEEIGVCIGRGQHVTSKRTKVYSCTAGWLYTTMLHGIKLTIPNALHKMSDFSLRGQSVTHVIIDDFHTGTVEVYFLLFFMKIISTGYTHLRTKAMLEAIEKFSKAEATSKGKDVQGLWGKLISEIHQLVTNRTRWTVMSATGVFDEKLFDYFGAYTRRFDSITSKFFNSDLEGIQKEKLQEFKESLLKLSMMPLPFALNQNDLASQALDVDFSHSHNDTLQDKESILLELEGKTPAKKLFHLEDLLNLNGNLFDREIIGKLEHNLQEFLRSMHPFHTFRNISYYMNRLAVQLCRHLLDRKDCDSILIFVPGRDFIDTLMNEFKKSSGMNFKPFNEIRDDSESLPAEASEKCILLPLRGEYESQILQKALNVKVKGKKKVYIATNVAETGLTIPGLTAVVDFGFCMSAHFDLESRETKVRPGLISQPSAIQRGGRVGREREGEVYRLYPREVYEQRMAFENEPEIRRVALDAYVLEVLKSAKKGPINKMVKKLTNKLENKSFKHGLLSHLLTEPTDLAVQSTLHDLHSRGAITAPNMNAEIANLGRYLTLCPSDPTSSNLLGRSYQLSMTTMGIIFAAILSAKNIFVRPNPRNEKGAFMRSLWNNTKGRIRSNIVKSEKDQLSFLHSDLLSVFSVYVDAMQYEDSTNADGRSNRTSILRSKGVHVGRFHALCLKIRDFAKTVLEGLYDVDMDELPENVTIYEKFSKFRSKKYDFLGLLFKPTWDTRDIETLFPYNATQMRVLMFLLFHRNLAVKEDNRPPKITISNVSGASDIAHDLALVNKITRAKVSQRSENKETIIDIRGFNCHKTREMDLRIRNLFWANFVPHSWDLGFAKSNDSLGLMNQANLLTCFWVALKHSNNMFFDSMSDQNGTGKADNSTAPQEPSQLHSTLQWKVLRSATGGETNSSRVAKKTRAPLRKRQLLDNVKTQEVSLRFENFSPSSLAFGTGNRLFAVVSDPVDVSRKETTKALKTGSLEGITSCETTLALYYFCFIIDLKVSLKCSDGKEIELYSDDMAQSWDNYVPSDLSDDRVSEVAITTLDYSLRLQTPRLTLTMLKDLLPLREQFCKLLTGAAENRTKSGKIFFDMIQKIDQHLLAPKEP